MEPINKELFRSQIILSIHIIRRNNDIRVCADFSTGLNVYSLTHIRFPSQGMFPKLIERIIFFSNDLSGRLLKNC